MVGGDSEIDGWWMPDEWQAQGQEQTGMGREPSGHRTRKMGRKEKIEWAID